ncbi:alpha-L-rhamnosidase C-terminal domain-containing protein [Draconibacterium sp. IB214405]|uniref:alpha-L-rhamnosidase-related protein n=1 Tax=Draconibacterium sp. IB214405 TaxID=3097352 RepID=UPI002A0B5492|nr:alpha-L-rhamnosidase C-terminal domain-containing protein [Draconibacterium sp. IB214405]MDX8337775.1 alpha-L-rhamnosidase C-terminal domain-containing protein [Draconibacterium sp. IB214405]
MKITRTVLTLFFITLLLSASAQTWIWFPGDYENWLGNQMNNRRTERGVTIPVQWKLDGHEPLMIFTKTVDLEEPEEIEVYAEGEFIITIGWRIKYQGIKNEPLKVVVPAGKNEIKIKVLNYAKVPALFVKGKTINSDDTWITSPLDSRYATKNMKHPYSPSGYFMNAGTGNLNDPNSLPSEFKLPTKPMKYVEAKQMEGGTLFDFGIETFGFVKFHQLSGTGKLTLQYGETAEEALDAEHCETFDIVDIPAGKSDYTMPRSNALRYIFVAAENAEYDDVSLLYEYAPVEYRASFKCNDEEVNKIWEVGRYTLQLTTREVFIDGIKRDRWAWSGDAYQSYLMNYYMFFDLETTKRTMYTLRGSEPVMVHLNNILDYSFYWFMGIYDYYQYTGDVAFLKQIYPKMESLMDFVLDRRNDRGLVEGLEGDWVYIDWFDDQVDITGEVSFEQIVFCKSLETMTLCSEILGIGSEAQKYDALAKDVRSKLSDFWNEEKQAFIFNRKDGVNSDQVTKHANMFAIFYDYVSTEQKEEIKKSVILNPNIPAISTPYMRFYELEAMCSLNEQEYVLSEIKDYWGGMLKLGATTFWEKYNPEHKGLEHYTMYGRPFGKSLCHAWGASPIYLLGKYFVGVKPTKPGYQEFEIRPVLGGLEWFESSIPTPNGDIKVYADKNKIKVKASEGEGSLIFTSKKQPKTDVGTIEQIGENEFLLKINGDGQEVSVEYRAL